MKIYNLFKVKGFRHRYAILSIIIAPILFIIFSCAVVLPPNCEKDGLEYSYIGDITIHYDWDSCYRRGLSYIKGGCLDYAMDQFKSAIKDRPDDTIFARPYGMHILGRFPRRELEIMGYFPNRELGILYYKKGQTKEAINRLEKSLKDSSSSKAMFYLNEARREWLQKNELDKAPPWLHLTFPSSTSHLTNQSELTIEGKALDDQYVSAISINNEPVFIELSAKTIPFTHTISMKEGKNPITIQISDLSGKTTKEKIEIIVDRMGPLINLSYKPLDFKNQEGDILLLRGLALDDSGVDKLTINGKPIDIERGKICEFGHRIDLSSDKRKISYEATDIAGNKTLGHMDLSSGKNPVGTHNLYTLYTDTEPGDKTYPNPEGHNPIRIASLNPFIPSSFESDRAENPFEENYKVARGPVPDPLLIFHESLPSITKYDQLPLYGTIIYKTPIKAINVLLNDKPIDALSYEAGMLKKLKYLLSEINRWLYKGGRKKNTLSFSWAIKLRSGQNIITIEVINENNEKTTETFRVLKKEEEILDQRYRMCILVTDSIDLSNPFLRIPLTDGYASVELTLAFVEQERFRLVERERLDIILKELKLSLSELFKKDIIKLGKLLNAEGICISYILKTNEGVELKGFMVDTETSVYLCAKDVYLETDLIGDRNKTISTAAKILAMKIRKNFPLCKGKVLEKDGSKILVDIGSRDKIRPDTKLIVYRERKWDTLILSEAKIEKLIDLALSSAILLNKENEKEIAENDLVITK